MIQHGQHDCLKTKRQRILSQLLYNLYQENPLFEFVGVSTHVKKQDKDQKLHLCNRSIFNCAIAFTLATQGAKDPNRVQMFKKNSHQRKVSSCKTRAHSGKVQRLRNSSRDPKSIGRKNKILSVKFFFQKSRICRYLLFVGRLFFSKKQRCWVSILGI